MRWKESDFWKHASPNELLNLFEHLYENDSIIEWVAQMESDDGFADLVFEYLWLCRSEEKTISLFNSPKFSADLILKFIYFGFGKQFMSGNFDSTAYFRDIKNMLNSEQSLRVLSLAEQMDKDPTLKIHLLANLDPQTWEAYFDLLEQNSMTMNALLGIFSNLRENEIRKILLNSPTLYYYLQMMMVSGAKDGDETELVKRNQLKLILDSVQVWDNFCNKIKSEFVIENEKHLPPRDRNGNRLSQMLRELVKVKAEDRSDIVSYIKGNGALIDESEETTLLFLLNNFDLHGRFI